MNTLTEKLRSLSELKADMAIKLTLMESLAVYAPAPIAAFDREMRYVFATNDWCSEFNLPSCDLIGKTHFEVFPDILSERPDWTAMYQRVLNFGETASSVRDEWQRPNGDFYIFRWKCVPARDKEQIIGLLMFCRVLEFCRNKINE